jgi:aminoglycoside 6'-N-acetyltransferase I
LCLAGAGFAKPGSIGPMIVKMGRATIRMARRGDEVAIGEMMASLWPDALGDEHQKDAAAVIETGRYGTLPGAILVAEDGEGQAIGFLQVGLRSHADGCDVGQSVGFVEGWWVREGMRRQGIGEKLMRAAEEWVCANGCIEIASDVLIDNEESLRAHGALGFEVADRCVHFRKRL